MLIFQNLNIIFFFNDTATTEIYTLSLHDALPISVAGRVPKRDAGKLAAPGRGHAARRVGRNDWQAGVHHRHGVRHPRIGAAIVSPVGRRSRHRVYGRSAPIELTFATVRHWTKVTNGPGGPAHESAVRTASWATTGPCALFIDPFGRPLSPVSAAGMHRRARRRRR